ncbi:hypothetical protein HanPI659440_Chr10g0369381 [Helianthus annuus]|nr:hypothetical protein HanPI659440_Chr10g0369381 [Helianthus annuus]
MVNVVSIASDQPFGSGMCERRVYLLYASSKRRNRERKFEREKEEAVLETERAGAVAGCNRWKADGHVVVG